MSIKKSSAVVNRTSSLTNRELIIGGPYNILYKIECKNISNKFGIICDVNFCKYKIHQQSINMDSNFQN